MTSDMSHSGIALFRQARFTPARSADYQLGLLRDVASPRSQKYPPSTAGNSMTTALRGPLRNHFWKKRRPQPYWGGENSGNTLEPSNAFNYRVWGIPAVLSRGIPGNALRAFLESFRNFSGIASGKSQPYWGYGPRRRLWISRVSLWPPNVNPTIAQHLIHLRQPRFASSSFYVFQLGGRCEGVQREPLCGN